MRFRNRCGLRSEGAPLAHFALAGRMLARIMAETRLEELWQN